MCSAHGQSYHRVLSPFHHSLKPLILHSCQRRLLFRLARAIPRKHAPQVRVGAAKGVYATVEFQPLGQVAMTSVAGVIGMEHTWFSPGKDQRKAGLLVAFGSSDRERRVAARILCLQVGDLGVFGGAR